MTNLGDIDVQTISGAIGTGTHGTGARFGGIADQVRGLQLVLADGSVVECGPDDDPELFQAARVGLGAFGVVTAVTLQCEPVFGLHAEEAPMALDDGARRSRRAGGRHRPLRVLLVPAHARTLTKRNHRLASGHAARAVEPAPRLPRRRAAVEPRLRGGEPRRHAALPGSPARSTPSAHAR